MIKTCVIFCGGYGTRLGSLTKKKPKPMVLVNKKPFLEHLLIQVRDIGIQNVYLLVGYKHQKIIKYFKNGKKLGLNIRYSFAPPKFETGHRLSLLKKEIKENFLLMYCDNYCSFNLEKHFEFFKKNKSLITFSVCKKKMGNIQLSKRGKAKYKIHRSKAIPFVEIGYMICSYKLLKLIDDKNINLNKYFKNGLISKKITALEIKNKYLSISDQERLKETRKYFSKKNIILIDRDGVLNLKNKKFRYIRNLNELKMNTKIINILEKFPKMKYICISNQAGIATKEVEIEDLNKINFYIKKFLKKREIKLIDFFISVDHFASNSFNRKPNPGYFLKAAEKYKLLLDKTFYVGDDPRDIMASFNCNTKCVYVGKKKELKFDKKSSINSSILKNLSRAIKSKYKSEY